MEYIIQDTKTSSGRREIPMSDDVYECFGRIIANRKKLKVEPMVSGRCGYLYLDKNNMPMVAMHWENISNISVRSIIVSIGYRCQR